MSGRRTFGSHRRSAWDDRKAAGSNPARSTKDPGSYAASREKMVHPGGSRIVNKKENQRKKESKASAVGFDSGNCGVGTLNSHPAKLGTQSKPTIIGLVTIKSPRRWKD